MLEIKTTRHRRLRWPTATFALTCLLVPALTAIANVPRSPALGRSQPVWIGFLFMFLMTAFVVAVSLMPSKRSHQD